jgi:hypothetical protein
MSPSTCRSSHVSLGSFHTCFFKPGTKRTSLWVGLECRKPVPFLFQSRNRCPSRTIEPNPFASQNAQPQHKTQTNSPFNTAPVWTAPHVQRVRMLCLSVCLSVSLRRTRRRELLFKTLCQPIFPLHIPRVPSSLPPLQKGFGLGHGAHVPPGITFP